MRDEPNIVIVNNTWMIQLYSNLSILDVVCMAAYETNGVTQLLYTCECVRIFLSVQTRREH